MTIKAYRVAPQKEFRAEALLQSQGAQAVVPFEWRTERCGSSRSRRRKVKRPLLNGVVLSSKPPERMRQVRVTGSSQSKEGLQFEERIVPNGIIKGCIGRVTNKEIDRLHATLIERSTPPPPAIEHEWKSDDVAIVDILGEKATVKVLEVSRKGAVMWIVTALPEKARTSALLSVGRTGSCSVRQLSRPA